ncbi:MAG: DUF2220 family protein [Lachnospiraceae bacterium]|nr:DUF2220 family protein [Lachnospiraceae bacterium]
MPDYEEKMLVLLVEKYRKSKKDNGTGRINRRTKIKPADLYKGYNRNDGDLEQINAINEAADKCRQKGFLTFEMQGFGNEIAAIYLSDEKIEETEFYLTEHYGYESKHEKMEQIKRILEKYSGHSPVADLECAKLQASLDRNVVPKDYKQTEDVLKALIFIEGNERLLYVREASMLIYGNSKYLEENTLDAVCSLLRKFWERPCKDNEIPDEILSDYQIVKEKQKICLKGNIALVKSGNVLDLGEFRSGIEFYADELEEIQRITVRDGRLITVENKTSYMRCREADTAYFYLGGYANRFQRDFLKKIYEDNPGIAYWHFGDIDAGGFYIHENLCKITGIPFGLYRMSAEELQDPRYEGCLLRLSDNDRKRLRALAEHEAYREVVQYMVSRNVKLEQEIVSYYSA